jgi:hypothetical protein
MEWKPIIIVRYLKRQLVFPAYEKIEFYCNKELEFGCPKLIRFQLKQQMFYETDDIVGRINEFKVISNEEIESVIMKKFQDDDLARLKELLDVNSTETIKVKIDRYNTEKSGVEFKFYSRRQECGINQNEVILNLHVQDKGRNNLHQLDTSIMDFVKDDGFRFSSFTDLQTVKKLKYSDPMIYNEFRVKMVEPKLVNFNAKKIDQSICNCVRLRLSWNNSRFIR